MEIAKWNLFTRQVPSKAAKVDQCQFSSNYMKNEKRFHQTKIKIKKYGNVLKTGQNTHKTLGPSTQEINFDK